MTKTKMILSALALLCSACGDDFTPFGEVGGAGGGEGGSAGDGGAVEGGGGATGGGGAGGAPPVCVDGAHVCDGSLLFTCEDGELTFAEDCAASSSVCAAGACELGLLALLRFDEGTGTVTLDESPAALVGQVQGPNWTSGRFGGALSFVPSSRVDLGDALGTLALPVTMTAWVNVDPTATGNKTLVATDGGGVNYAGVWLSVNHDNGHTFAVSFGDGGTGPAGRNSKVSSSSITAGVWTHLGAVLYAPGNFALYADGIYADGIYEGTAAQLVTTSAPFLIGNADWNGEDHGAHAVIDEVRIYNRALSPAEIAALAVAR